MWALGFARREMQGRCSMAKSVPYSLPQHRLTEQMRSKLKGILIILKPLNDPVDCTDAYRRL